MRSKDKKTTPRKNNNGSCRKNNAKASADASIEAVKAAAADGAAVGSSRQGKGAKKGADGAGAGRSQKVVPFDAIVGKFACLCDGGSA